MMHHIIYWLGSCGQIFKLRALVIRTILSSQSFFKCLPATEAIKTPDQRLWRNTTELFIISTACTAGFPPCLLRACGICESGRHTEELRCLLPPHHHHHHHPAVLSPLPCISPLCFCLEVELIVLASSIAAKASLACDAEQAKKSTGVWHVSSNAGSERRSAAFRMQAGLA